MPSARSHHLGWLGCGLLFVFLPLACVLLYEPLFLGLSSSTREPGAPPVSEFLTVSRRGRPVDVIVSTTTGTRLADVAEMCVFGDYTVGTSARDVVAATGQSTFTRGSFQITTVIERHHSGTLYHDIPFVYARPTPESGALLLSHCVARPIADHIARLRYTGSFYIHNGDHSGNLTITVQDGVRVVCLRWYGAA